MYQIVQGPKLGSECDPCFFGNLPNSETFECDSHFRGNATKLAVSVALQLSQIMGVLTHLESFNGAGVAHQKCMLVASLNSQ